MSKTRFQNGLTFSTQGLSSLFGVNVSVHVMEDSPKSMRAVLLEAERLLHRFFEVACKSGGEVGASNT